MRSQPTPRFLILILLAALILLAGCGLSGGSTPAGTVTSPPTARPSPSASPQVPLAILVIPADMAKDQADQYETAVYDLAQAAGMRFQVLNTLTPADLQLVGPALKVVIVFPPDPGLAALVAAAPQVQFLAIGISNLPSAPNLSTLASSGKPLEQEAFLAGYTAALLAQDYRIGMISLKDDPQAGAAETAFTNGMHFYCGLCLTQFPPMYTYPLFNEIPQDESQASYPAYGSYLITHQVSIVYVYPPLATPLLLNSLAQGGLYLIGESMTTQAVKANWIASLQPELLPTIQKAFPDLVAGHGGQTIASPIYLADVNPGLVSQGKLRLVQQTLDGLLAGTIGTGVNP